jgi:hypothetical protein
MVLGPTLRSALTRISKALNEFASETGWKSGEYRILFALNQKKWGLIRVFFVVKDFEGLSEQDMWGRVWDNLEKSLKSGPDIGYSIGLSVHTWDQVKEGGIYSIPDDYADEEEFVNTTSRAN